MNLSASDIVRAINNLPKDRDYYYINSSTKTHMRIIHVALPEWPISIKRYDPDKGETLKNAKTVTISSNGKTAEKVVTIKGNIESKEQTENGTPVKKDNSMAPKESNTNPFGN